LRTERGLSLSGVARAAGAPTTIGAGAPPSSSSTSTSSSVTSAAAMPCEKKEGAACRFDFAFGAAARGDARAAALACSFAARAFAFAARSASFAAAFSAATFSLATFLRRVCSSRQAPLWHTKRSAWPRYFVRPFRCSKQTWQVIMAVAMAKLGRDLHIG